MEGTIVPISAAVDVVWMLLLKVQFGYLLLVEVGVAIAVYTGGCHTALCRYVISCVQQQHLLLLCKFLRPILLLILHLLLHYLRSH